MIRLAKEEDLPEILEMYNDAILNTTAVYHYVPNTLEDRAKWLHSKQEAGEPVFVYEENGHVLGFATFGPFRPWPAYKYTIEHSVYVASEGKRKGIGTALLEKLIETAKERGFATMVGGIDDTNLGSIKLHEKFGFTYAGTIRKAGYKFGKWLNLAFYQLELPGPDHPVETV